MTRYEFYVDSFKWCENQIKEMSEMGYSRIDCNIAYTHMRAMLDRLIYFDELLTDKERTQLLVVCGGICLRNIRQFIH